MGPRQDDPVWVYLERIQTRELRYCSTSFSFHKCMDDFSLEIRIRSRVKLVPEFSVEGTFLQEVKPNRAFEWIFPLPRDVKFLFRFQLVMLYT